MFQVHLGNQTFFSLPNPKVCFLSKLNGSEKQYPTWKRNLYLPAGFADILCKIDDDLLQYAEQLICDVEEPLLVANKAFRRITEVILQDTNFPSFAAYLMLVEKFTTVLYSRGISIPSTFAEANEIYQLLANESWTL